MSADAASFLHGGGSGAMALLGLTGQARVRVVGDAEMARAHERYKSQPGTTDVLTFDLTEPGGPLDADVLVCADEAARQAADRGIGVERELLLYIVHALLHCAGHDDATEEGFARMHAREDEILESLGVGATFAAPRTAAPAAGGPGGSGR